jgi:hypothetical protein
MSHVHLSLGKLTQLHVDGIPLDLAASLLPRRTLLIPGLYVHLHLHAKLVAKHADSRKKLATRQLSAKHLVAIAGSLLALVKRLAPKKQATEWDSYYTATNYSDEAFGAKRRFVREMVEFIQPATIWDIGGNNGAFSRGIADLAREILCMDIDPSAVNANYLACKKDGIGNVLPLIVDWANPSPAIGFANKERPGLEDRGRPDLILALALVHHLAISNNLPFDHIARHFAQRCDHLLVEFVAKSDSQVQRLLLNRRDIFADYSEERFRDVFASYFSIVMERTLPGAERTLFLMRRKTF